MAFSKAEQQELRNVADEMADAAREVTLRYFRSAALAVDNKEASGFDPVTVADREAEQAMRAVLAELPDEPETAAARAELGIGLGAGN